MTERDRESQRFLWRDQPDDEIKTLEMCPMSFGATCSPSLAQHVKNLNAKEFEAQYPRAVRAIVENHYVDDWLDSFATEEEAIQTAKEVKMIHGKAGFEIRKWTSNSTEVIRAMGEDASESGNPAKNLNVGGLSGDPQGAKVLGLWWCTSEDCLFFSI